MSNDEFNKVELPAIKQLQSMGWTYFEGKNLSPEESDERASFKDVILEKRLRNSLKKINPWINDQNLSKVIRDLTSLSSFSFLEANQEVWDKLVNFISVEQDIGKGRKNQTVKIIDFENISNNEFIVTNQFKIEGVIQTIIPDIILFVNGLPLAVIECKSPFIERPMESGIDQLLRYSNRRNPSENEGCEKLFHYNQIMISTHRDGARASTISAKLEHYLEWKDPYPININDMDSDVTSQNILITGMLSKQNFLDLIQNFIVFETENGVVIKKLARYQQFRAVHKTLKKLKTVTDPKERGGIIWHTQGSGKTLTMVFLTMKIRKDSDLKDYKLVFLTDRTQLDNQLNSTFANTQGQSIYSAKNVKELSQLLKKDASDIVTGMMQKFREGSETEISGMLNSSDRILIICDEAHRTQYGTFATFMNEALPNATKLAFTGTPLMKSEKTANEFGSYIDTYTIEQSVEDGATVNIIYEGREPKTKIEGSSLDQLFDKYFSDKTAEEKAKIRDKYGTRKAILEAKNRVRDVCKDILIHYETSVKPNGFKAMIVTNSRNAAVTYKEVLDELNAPESAVIISGDNNDPGRLRQYTDPVKQKNHIENFKKPINENALSFVIVKDMLLTGFNAPNCQVMYLDRKLTDHNLLQAIARVNRTKDKKECGYIVDYYGLSDYLTQALDEFTQSDIKGALVSIKEQIPRLQALHTKCKQHFKGLDLNDLDTCIVILRDETKRKQFEFDFRSFSKQMEIVMPNPLANPFIKDLKLLGKICHGARNLYRDPQLDIAGAGAKVRELIESHIVADGVDPKIPPTDLLADNFKERVNAHKSSQTRAYDIESAIRYHIDINKERDPEYYLTLSEKMEQIIKDNEGRWEQLELILMEMSENIETEREQKGEILGLNEIEIAFYNTLEKQVKIIRNQDDLNKETQNELISVIKALFVKLEEATSIVDFFKKQDEMNAMKIAIRRTIIDSSFDNEMIRNEITDKFMEIAEVHFK